MPGSAAAKTIVFVGEGPSDVGGENERGVVPGFVKRIVEDHIDGARRVDFDAKSRRWKDIGLHGEFGKGPGGVLGRKLKRAAFEAFKEGCDGVVVVKDRDKGRKSDLLKQLRDGRTSARQNAIGIPIALGVPIREIETWLLADEQALRRVLPDADFAPIKVPLENLKDPKGTLKQIMSSRTASDHDEAALRSRIAEEADPQRIALRCPNGFAPFKKDVEKEIAPLFRI